LWVVSRYREEIAKSGPGLEAMKRTMATSGKTVFFSSLTVAAALASLRVFPQRFLYSMGLGGTMVALLAATIALTVLPAVLALLGNRVNSLAPKFLQRRAERDATVTDQGFWYRLSHFIMRRPIGVATVTAAVLLVLGIPFYSMKFTSVDAQILGTEHSARQVDDSLNAAFPPHRDSPVRVLVENATPATTATVEQEVRNTDGIVKVNPPVQLAHGDVYMDAIADSSYNSDRSHDIVKAVRA